MSARGDTLFCPLCQRHILAVQPVVKQWHVMMHHACYWRLNAVERASVTAAMRAMYARQGAPLI